MIPAGSERTPPMKPPLLTLRRDWGGFGDWDPLFLVCCVGLPSGWTDLNWNRATCTRLILLDAVNRKNYGILRVANCAYR